MVVIVKLLGLIIAALVICLIIKPQLVSKWMDFWKKGKNMYLGGLISLIIGTILLLAASQCKLTWIVVLVGILSLIKGILLFVLKPAKIELWMNWWISKPVIIIRLALLFNLGIGLLLIYSA
ncbi:MAG: hypothetical protein DRZ76_00210 [Candidatus Nealsonbacteria bacterium]|nr:MAG: hypothetical protein DRZ76_00210 [Candidatus Nealsonbacteria bacterium]